MDGLVNTLTLELGHIRIRFGTFGACGRDGYYHIWIGGGSRFLGHYGWLTAIAVGFPKISFHILHCPGKLV